jgi:menaquinone-specific isochorismate synthase
MIPDDGDLTCWLRHGRGMIGLGVAHRGSFNCAARAENWWRELVRRATIKVDPGVSDIDMAGPVAFLSFPFAAQGTYEMVVPKVVIGRDENKGWITAWNGSTWNPPASTPKPHRSLTFHPDGLDHDHWICAVDHILERIDHGDVDKVVLARAEIAESDQDIDIAGLVTRLATTYPQTWTFAVAKLIGATPELLVRSSRGQVASRVLAGTIDPSHDEASAQALRTSGKDLAEHEYAVASVARGLSDHVTNLKVPDCPFVLRLPNVMHLASDITATAKPGSTAIRLADAIHPSAAVGGTPTSVATAIIEQIEPVDRGRYAGPVGWVNAAGDGEIGLALRCGMIDAHRARIFAGCGIVADSSAQAEWEETVAKLRPMKQALTPA